MSKTAVIPSHIDATYFFLFLNDIDLQNRRIYIFDDIEAETVSTVIKALHMFNDQDLVAPIEIYIRSDGGVVEDMFALYDAICQSEAPIHTIGVGCVASAACLILAAGHSRFATENCTMMHHLSKQGKDDSADEREVEAQAGAMKRLAERTYILLAKHSKKTAKTWKREAERKGEVWMDSKEMLEWGVIDEVIPSPKRSPKRKRTTKVRKTTKVERKKGFNSTE
jgi:ATP-dependent Clp protease protease subunit